MDVILELLFRLIGEVLLELFGQALFEGLFEIFGRSAQATQAELLGRGETSWTWRIVAYAVLVAVAGGLGLWRGGLADGDPTFGVFSAIAVTIVCVAATFMLPQAAPEPPANVWNRVLTWWPRRRLAWFATGNAVFAAAYLVAM